MDAAQAAAWQWTKMQMLFVVVMHLPSYLFEIASLQACQWWGSRGSKNILNELSEGRPIGYIQRVTDRGFELWTSENTSTNPASTQGGGFEPGTSGSHHQSPKPHVHVSSPFQLALSTVITLTGVSFQSAVLLVEAVWRFASDPATTLNLRMEGWIAVAWDQPWKPKHAIHFHVVCLKHFNLMFSLLMRI